MIRKFLLSLVLLVFAGSLSAQTLLFEQNGNVIEPGEYYVINDINDMMELHFEFNVTNLNDVPVDVTCTRVEYNTSGTNYFCWGQCLAPNMSEGTITAMEPGVPNLFSAHFMPLDESGMPALGSVLYVDYLFYDNLNNQEYTFSIYFEYTPGKELVFEYDGNFVEPGSYEVIGDINDMMELQYEVNAINVTGEPASVTCTRVEIATSGTNYFCWGQCLAPNMSEGTIENMAPGIPNLFSAHFMPLDESGMPAYGSELFVEYHFSVRGSEEVYIFAINFKLSGTSVEDYNDVNVFSNAYPNPASSTLSFDYNMPQSANSSYIAIYNMLGQEVIRENVSVGGSRIDLNVSDLTEGIYFYSLIVNNEKVKTNKFIVSR